MHTSGTVEGEQLLSQLLRAIPDRQWLFKYGRVPMNFILATRMWEVKFICFQCKQLFIATLAIERRGFYDGTLQGVCDGSSYRRYV